MFGSSERKPETGKLSTSAYLINRLGSFQNNLIDFCYHGFNQHIYLCEMLFNYNVPENVIAWQTLWTDIAKIWEWSAFFLLNKRAFLKNQSLVFIHQCVSRYLGMSIVAYPYEMS